MSGNLVYKQEVIEEPDAEVIPLAPEICFQIPESGELQLDLQKHGSSILEYLRFCVARNPSDLLSHLRRVILQNEAGDPENLFAALIDLFIALGSKGESLRSRLLKKYRANLSKDHYRVLSDSLKNDTGVDSRILEPNSVLAKGITGTCSLIRTVADSQRQENSSDPLQEARQFLEYSQIEEARLVLEQALRAHPGRRDVQKELLELYRAGRDLDNFQKVYGELTASGTALSEEWSAVLDFLSENA